MDAESFTDLALRTLSGEATPEERRTLETEMNSHPAFREEFQQLALTHDLLRTAAPMSEALRAEGPELPTYRVNELRTAVREHFGPAAQRATSPAKTEGWRASFRWIFAGGTTTLLAVVAIVLIFTDRSVEVGLYRTDLVRGPNESLATSNAHLRVVTFDQDAPFDQWQKTLAWYQHAKIWADNEHNLLHVVKRDARGNITDQTEPLAATDQAQREQINQVAESLKK